MLDPATEVAGRRDLVTTSPNKEVPELATEVVGRRDLADSSLPGEVSLERGSLYQCGVAQGTNHHADGPEQTT